MCGWWFVKELLPPTLPPTPKDPRVFEIEMHECHLRCADTVMSVYHLILQFDSGTNIICNDSK